MLSKSLFINLLCILAITLNASAQTANRLIKEADDFFEHGHFREALQYYKQGGSTHTWDKATRLRVAISSFEINDLDASIQILDQLDRDVKTEPDVFFYLARAYQFNNNFDAAVEYYKNFIRASKRSDIRREWVKDEILRCASGLSTKYADQQAYVENLGTSINTFYDEFGPTPSPLYMDRLYFSSARPGSKGGLKDPANIDDQKYGDYNFDMYSSENKNGIWRAAEAMGDVLNSTRNDIIYGFSPNGQQLFYYTGEDLHSGQLIIDTFSVERTGSTIGSSLGPFNPSSGDSDLFIYNDTIILFSSNRSGGYGGYDLYFSVNHLGVWSRATNLGATINTFYNEKTPFLTRNGRTLYFASNNLMSIGGLDIFRSTFSDSLIAWSTPYNMGLPINSAGDETDFQIAQDGLTAYFASDKKSGYGKRDLYAAYMKKAEDAHMMISRPMTFIQMLPLDLSTEIAVPSSPVNSQNVKEYYIGDLSFEPNDLVLTPQNLKKLDVISNLLLIYPTLKLDLICHDVVTSTTSFDLYFSIKKSEQVADYLAGKGIKRSRLYIKGCGSFYPRAVDTSEIKNTSLDRLNRRIELHVYETADLPISLIYEFPNIPSDVHSNHAQAFNDMQTGLVYRVQIASVSQMFQHEIFDKVEDAMIQWDPATLRYKYYIGLESTFDEALTIRNNLRTLGFGDAFIVAHVEGHQITQKEIDSLSEKYPDLLLLK